MATIISLVQRLELLQTLGTQRPSFAGDVESDRCSEGEISHKHKKVRELKKLQKLEESLYLHQLPRRMGLPSRGV